MDYCDIEWFALETNKYHSAVFEITAKYFISDSFVDYEIYSVFFFFVCLFVFVFKGFLPTVVDIMVMRMKFTHSVSF